MRKSYVIGNAYQLNCNLFDFDIPLHESAFLLLYILIYIDGFFLL